MDVAQEAGGEGVLRTEEAVAERRHSLRNRVHPIPRALIQLEKPYIAAVNGAAVGAGMDMASMADIRFASERARFGMAYVRMGLIPGDGGAWSLPRIVGTAKALELIWSGELINAQEALRIGLRERSAPAGGAARAHARIRPEDRERAGHGHPAREEARLTAPPT